MGVLRDDDIRAVVSHSVKAAAHYFAVVAGSFDSAVIKHNKIITPLFKLVQLAANAVFVVKVHAGVIIARSVVKPLGNVVKSNFEAVYGKLLIAFYFGCAVAPAEIPYAVIAERFAGVEIALLSVVHRMGVAQRSVIYAEIFYGFDG